jgi:hypothetical protein
MVYDNVVHAYKPPNKNTILNKTEFLRVYGELMFETYLQYSRTHNVINLNPFMVIHFKSRGQNSEAPKENENSLKLHTNNVIKVTTIEEKIIDTKDIQLADNTYMKERKKKRRHIRSKDIKSRPTHSEVGSISYHPTGEKTKVYEVIGSQTEVISTNVEVPIIPIYLVNGFNDVSCQTDSAEMVEMGTSMSPVEETEVLISDCVNMTAETQTEMTTLSEMKMFSDDTKEDLLSKLSVIVPLMNDMSSEIKSLKSDLHIITKELIKHGYNYNKETRQIINQFSIDNPNFMNEVRSQIIIKEHLGEIRKDV